MTGATHPGHERALSRQLMKEMVDAGIGDNQTALERLTKTVAPENPLLQPAIQRLTSGKTRNPFNQTLATIAAALEYSGATPGVYARLCEAREVGLGRSDGGPVPEELINNWHQVAEMGHYAASDWLNAVGALTRSMVSAWRDGRASNDNEEAGS
jgi:uncharacterized protein with NAD-binding domain and iron-sulfur cluster